jgi:hypothetical protein
LGCFLSESELVIALDGKRIAIKSERKTMHLLFTPIFAIDEMVAPSGALVIVILAVLAVLRGR